MGYTNYWKPKVGVDEKTCTGAKLAEFVEKMLEITRTPIVGPCGEHGSKPIITHHHIMFNGLEEDCHESFSFEVGSGLWDFCKTAQKPYDRFVVAALMKADELGLIAPAEGKPGKTWYSDGDAKDHAEGKKLYKKVNKALEEKYAGA